jgi:hypothetical protein
MNNGYTGGSGNAAETAKWRQINCVSVGVGALANSMPHRRLPFGFRHFSIMIKMVPTKNGSNLPTILAK